MAWRGPSPTLLGRPTHVTGMSAKEEPQSCPEVELFGRKLRAARRGARMSQRELHEATGIAASFISAVERGERNISIARAAALAKAVGQPLYRLLTP